MARLEQYFTANDIEERKKVAILLNVVGDETFELITDLFSPEKPEMKRYQDIVETVQRHLQAEPSEIAERYKFRQRKQLQGESIAQYVAAFKKLAKSCKFGNSLEENLQVQLSLWHGQRSNSPEVVL